MGRSVRVLLSAFAAALASVSGPGHVGAAVEGIGVTQRHQAASGVHEVVVRMGGARIRALCVPGPIEVLLLHGEDSSAETWRPVLARLEGRVGACAYDRLGSGESRPAPEPRGWYELLDELRRIHRALGAEAPYVLVGHDLGGLYASAYARDRPLDVAGLVLVEPAHRDMPRRMRTGMPADEWNAWVTRRDRPNEDGVVERLIAERTDRLRSARFPVTVLTATRRNDGDGWDARFLNEAARQVHQSIVQGLTLGRHVPATGSGPFIQRDDPGRVADEIVRVVEATRRMGISVARPLAEEDDGIHSSSFTQMEFLSILPVRRSSSIFRVLPKDRSI